MENEGEAKVTTRCPCCNAATCRCHTCNARFACGESPTCPMPCHGAEAVALRCRCGAAMSAGGVITASGRYVPFMTETVRPHVSLMRRLHARSRQAFANREAATSMREAAASSREAASSNREPAASSRPTTASTRPAAVSSHLATSYDASATSSKTRRRTAPRFAWTLRAPIGRPRAVGNYADVLERSRAAKHAETLIASAIVADDHPLSQAHPTA